VEEEWGECRGRESRPEENETKGREKEREISQSLSPG
jgi:hypothetical protein